MARFGFNLALRARPDPDSGDPDWWWIEILFNGEMQSAFQFNASSGTAFQTIVGLAQHVQEDAFESDLGVWPQCADHDYPLDPTVVDDIPAWVCPIDITLVIPIGKLQRTIRHER